MNAPHIILDCLPSLCQKLSDLVAVWRSYNKNNFPYAFLRHGVDSGKMLQHTRQIDITCPLR